MEGIIMESVWVAAGFVVFVALIWRRVGAAVGKMLDDRSQRIKLDLDEARSLREEALEELLDQVTPSPLVERQWHASIAGLVSLVT